MLATAFRAHADLDVPGLVFARGVSDSGSTDEAEYRRELELLSVAATFARRLHEPLVYFSGAPIYGTFELERSEDDDLHPRTRYGRHQRDAEQCIQSSGARYLIARTPNVVGPGGHHHQLIPALVNQALTGSVSIQSGASRDLVDVEDVVMLTQTLLAQNVSASVVNLATGISTPVEVIARRIVEILAVETLLSFEVGGESQRFGVARLTSMVGPLPFDNSYPLRVLDRHVPGIAATYR